jgi:hypothetical protein
MIGYTTYILHILFIVISQLVLHAFNLLIFIYCILIHYCKSVFIVLQSFLNNVRFTPDDGQLYCRNMYIVFINLHLLN